MTDKKPVWRKVPGQKATVVGPYPSARPPPHETKRTAVATVIVQKRADQAAATRLGLTVLHPETP